MTRGTPRTPRFILLIPSAVVDSMFVYLRARFRFALIGGNLTAQSTGSRKRIGRGIQIPETWLQTLLPFPALPLEGPGDPVRGPYLGLNDELAPILHDVPKTKEADLFWLVVGAGLFASVDSGFRKIHVPRAWRVYLATGFDFREKKSC